MFHCLSLIYYPGRYRTPVGHFYHLISPVYLVVKQRGTRILSRVKIAIQRRIVCSITKYRLFGAMTHCQFRSLRSIQNRFDRPVAYVKGITVTVNNRNSLISYLNNSQETGGRTTVNPCSQVPLVGILCSGDGGRHYKTIRLGQRKNMSSKKLCHSHILWSYYL